MKLLYIDEEFDFDDIKEIVEGKKGSKRLQTMLKELHRNSSGIKKKMENTRKEALIRGNKK